jgi:IS5 family transposase
MRRAKERQMKIGQVSIGKIQFDLRSRDEIPKILIGLQQLYCNEEIREKVFQELMKVVPEDIDPNNGRPGMDLWRILVLGTVRLSCNWDYDKLTDIANNHKTLRLMIGHSDFGDRSRYALQTLKDNVSLFTPEALDRINRIVVEHGHELIGKKAEVGLKASCDSFVVETDVHYPTDINLLFDAVRKMIAVIMTLCGQVGLGGWRQGSHHIRKVKRLFRKAQKLKRSTAKDSDKKAKRDQLVIKAHVAYLELAQSLVERARESIEGISIRESGIEAKVEAIQEYIAHAERQIDQINRRVVKGETIPHEEKVFSIFEEHTEWISKGKAGVPQELGVKVCIVRDQFGFMLHHRVMEQETDDEIAVGIIRETKERFAGLSSCSLDKGFHSVENQKELSEILDKVILPRKGKLSAITAEIEQSEEFKRARQKHSAVESSVNALENHGLDRCLDHGVHGFKRYVALAVVARNIQIIGHIHQQKELKRQQRAERRQQKRKHAA